jgi:pyrroline-5-carboxylate reductase
MSISTIAFIGAGNMAAALIQGLLKDGFAANRILAADPDTARTQALADCCGIRTSDDNALAIAQADLVVLAVKPQILPALCQQVSQAVSNRKPLIISIAAGIQTSHLASWLGAETAIIRTMPNTPAMVQAGTTVLYANQAVSEEQRNLAESVMRAVGMTLWIQEETMMDSITALSGSGPAYFFLFMEAMIKAGVKLGLDEQSAKLLTLHTAFGAARMALESPDNPAILRDKVTSPNGTTAAALDVFRAQAFEQIVADALRAARDRSIELSSQVQE